MSEEHSLPHSLFPFSLCGSSLFLLPSSAPTDLSISYSQNYPLIFFFIYNLSLQLSYHGFQSQAPIKKKNPFFPIPLSLPESSAGSTRPSQKQK